MVRAATSILVADEERDTRSRLTRALRREGYDAVPASSGAEALDLARNRAVRITILDVLLPDLSGIDTFELITGFREVEGIFLARERTKETLVRLLDAGAFTVLDKPPRLDWLLEAVRRLDERLGSASAPEAPSDPRRGHAPEAPKNFETRGGTTPPTKP
jgi:DNA-binding response OmpR family regulator